MDMDDFLFGFFWFIFAILAISGLFWAGWSIGREYLVDKLCRDTQYEFCEPMETHYKLKTIRNKNNESSNKS